ncbi:MAG: glycine cleavage T C-terminal barrel domain-containing protein, partial [Pseudomonadota bacterium]
QLYAAYLALRAAGQRHGLRLFGARAVESMRLEKGYLHWKAELITEYDPFETGLARFVDLSKAFIGREALQRRQDAGPRRRLVTLNVASTDRPAIAGASVMAGDATIGTVTSGAWGFRTGHNLAMAFVDAEQAAPDAALSLDLLGDRVDATVVPSGPYDPQNIRVRS